VICSRTIDDVDAERLSQRMRRLGWLYFVGVVAHFSVDGRSVLLGPMALLAVPTLLSIGEAMEPADTRRYMALSAVFAGGAAAVGIANLFPGLEPGGLLLLASVCAALSSAAYARAMSTWCRAAGWKTLAASWGRADRTALGMTIIALGLIVSVLVTGEHVGASPASGSLTPNVAFGRRLEGPVIVAAAMLLIVATLVTTWRLAGGHRSMHSAFEEHGLPAVHPLVTQR